jgi:hypothetical protein
VTTGLVSVTVVGLTTVYEIQYKVPAICFSRRPLTSGVASRNVDRGGNVSRSADGGNVNSSCRVSDGGQVASRSRSNIFGGAGSADACGRSLAAGLGSGVAGAARLGRALALATLSRPDGGGRSALALGGPNGGGRGGL